jgi:hypothetical protein
VFRKPMVVRWSNETQGKTRTLSSVSLPASGSATLIIRVGENDIPLKLSVQAGPPMTLVAQSGEQSNRLDIEPGAKVSVRFDPGRLLQIVPI